MLGIIGASAALGMTEIPFAGPASWGNRGLSERQAGLESDFTG